MKVKTRSGKLEPLSLDKIKIRILSLISKHRLDLSEDYVDTLMLKVVNFISDCEGISTSEIDEETSRITVHDLVNLDAPKLASIVIISNHHKKTLNTFSEKMCLLNKYGLIRNDFYSFVLENSQQLDTFIDYNRDFDLDYFAFKTLENSYLLRTNAGVIERPQDLFMRVAIDVSREQEKYHIETTLMNYTYFSKGYLTHATPTLFNSGSNKTQYSSCYLLTTEDSVEGMYKTVLDCATISKYAGGIGLSVSNIRCKSGSIQNVKGKAEGLVPYARVLNETARHIKQNKGRPGSFALYLEPWHADVLDFLDLKKNNGTEEFRARDLFYALWIPDYFMECVKSNKDWYLMCPHECPGLNEIIGPDFVKLYSNYIEKGMFVKKVKAQDIWRKILDSQIETGVPYMLYKDSCNLKSNQKNLGTIKSSNLCSEIVQYSDNSEIAVCNLASISLPKFVEYKSEEGKLVFNHSLLRTVTRLAIDNLNRVIDNCFYPNKETEKSNKLHRPVGLGVQGLAYTFFKLAIPFDSEEAIVLNREIFETIYFSALERSNELCLFEGPYKSFHNSPMSEGKFQFDLWKECNSDIDLTKKLSGRWDWELLRKNIVQSGLRNSLLTTCMPTASTAQILSNSECIEPITSNMFSRGVSSGEFIVVNKYLMNDLKKLNLWTTDMKNQIMYSEGSIQNIPNIPINLKKIYKTVWEINQKVLIDQSADRGLFIDQSQSLNLFVSDPSHNKLTSMHFYSWSKGLKTGLYYLRTKSATGSAQVTVDETRIKELLKTEGGVCKYNINGNNNCESCSS